MKCVLIFFLTLACSVSFSQERVTTKSGKVVQLNANGTWENVKEDTSNPEDLSCESLIVTTTDKVDGSTTTKTKESLVVSKDGKEGFGINLYLFSKTIVFSINAVGAGSCIDKGDKANILFRDGSRMELLNGTDFNCDNSFAYYMGSGLGNKKKLTELATKEIETLRVWTSDGYVQETFTSDQSKRLMSSFACLIKK